MTTTSSDLAPLPSISISSLAASPPNPLIKTEEDVLRWHKSSGFQTYALFVQRLNEAVGGHKLDEDQKEKASDAVEGMIKMLDVVESWVDDIPLQTSSQRFGNLAFRDWGRRLEDQASTLLKALLPPAYHSAIPHLVPYLILSFGSFGRIDYGSGHELCFAIFLLCLTLLRFFDPDKPGEESDLVLRVFLRYLRVVWKLQDIYRLEPAGSHGVWGLDDYHFLSYLWGSAQIRDDPSLTPTSILSPPPSGLPPTNLYNLSISRISQLKTGPFHEHSPQLYSISMGVAKWSKVNSGLWKMYVAEVLGKRVVVQHVPLGGMIGWEVAEGDNSKDENAGKVKEASPSVGTKAPWAYSPTPYTPTQANLPIMTSLPPMTRRGNSSSTPMTPTRFPTTTRPPLPPPTGGMPPPTTFPSRRQYDQI